MHTVVFVHGAFAESTGWHGVAHRLHAAGHPVIAAANPLRGVAGDAAWVSDLVRTIHGSVVLVGHSYGGAVITNVDADAADITGLVYVAAFAPDEGETCNENAQRFPGSTLGEAVQVVPRGDGGPDLLIARDRFHEQFCADVPADVAGWMAATQRPTALAAFEEPSGPDPLWKHVPSSFVIAGEDRNIPPELQRFFAERSNAAKVVDIAGASHAVFISHPEETADVIALAAHPAKAAA